MARTPSIKQILNSPDWIDQRLKVSGWVRTRRDSKAGISFIALSDGSCVATLQCVVPSDVKNYASEVQQLSTGCAVSIEGILVASPTQGQALELRAIQVTVLGWVENPASYPMVAKRHTLEHLRDFTHLRARTNIIAAISRVRHHLAQALHQFFSKRGFFWVNTPIISACDCEGAGDLFTVTTLDMHHVPRDHQGLVDYLQDFFGRKAFLTVSGQLNLEAYCMALSKVYTFGPTFRSEHSNTTRHLAEFWMVEPEIAFADLEDLMDLAEALLKSVCQNILDHCTEDMAFFNQWVDKELIVRLESMIKTDFIRLNYTDAISFLKKAKHTFTYPIEWGMDLQTEHERYLTEKLYQAPVIIKNYPKQIKAFYMRLNDDQKTMAAMDLLLPGIGEMIGGSEREERFHALQQRLKEHKLDEKDYRWYLDLRRYGSARHAGFGLGFERLLRYITGINNVRDVIPYPRTPGSIPPNSGKIDRKI